MWAFSGGYELFVFTINVLVKVAICFSTLVAADRLINVFKYLLIKAREKVTGHRPEHDWHLLPLPDDFKLYPKVRKRDINANIQPFSTALGMPWTVQRYWQKYQFPPLYYYIYTIHGVLLPIAS